MLIGTQIKSFLVPFEIWHHGYDGRRDLPPIAVPARDALDIERRFLKGASLRNESQRYTLCCERIQGIVSELASEVGILREPILFPSEQAADETKPSARSYLALIDTIRLKLRGSPYQRVSAIFFPPDHAMLHWKVYEAMHGRDDLHELFIQATKRVSLPDDVYNPTTDQCSKAFAQRHQLLKIAASERSGIVDAVEPLLEFPIVI